MFTSLAYGAKGILWFTYWEENPAAYQIKGGSIITVVGDGPNEQRVRGPKYAIAKKINSVVLAFERHLMAGTSIGVWHAVSNATGGSVADQLQGCPVLADISGQINGSYLVGVFEFQDGRLGAMLHNQDPFFNSWPTITFQPSINASSVYEVTPTGPGAGTEHIVLDDSPGLPGLQLTILAGAARLLVFS